MFHQLGYNVLIPDARAHGQSQGKYIGYGWPEKYDVRKWVNKDLSIEGRKQQIVIFGVSMGGATTMMTSGLKMPKQVKAYIEDCGYSDVKAEFMHEAKDLYGMPQAVATSAVTLLSGVSKANLGFYLGDASAVKQLKRILSQCYLSMVEKIILCQLKWCIKTIMLQMVLRSYGLPKVQLMRVHSKLIRMNIKCE